MSRHFTVPHPVRLLLRRIAAIVVTLSVLSFTLGLTHAACDDPTGVRAAAVVEQAAPDAPHGDCGQLPAAPGEHESGAATCLVVAGCGTTMLIASAEASLDEPPAPPRLVSADDAGPRGPALEPEQPPPRA